MAHCMYSGEVRPYAFDTWGQPRHKWPLRANRVHDTAPDLLLPLVLEFPLSPQLPTGLLARGYF
jgi:hypothetical protein